MQLFEEQKTQLFKRTDRLFVSLLIVEWLCLVLVAAIVSPRTWVGTSSYIHPHIWTAIVVGALTVSLPVILVKMRTGATITRHMIAVAQMVLAGLLIHLTGGRIESHFLIFGSLAFLAFYRDWRVLITASAITAVDHIFRGMFYPESIYGLINASPWRTVEHVFWVVFEDIFLILGCRQSVKEMQEIAIRQTEVEVSKENVELQVEERTKELKLSEKQLAVQYEVSKILAESITFNSCSEALLQCISNCALGDEKVVCSAIWAQDDSRNALRCASFWSRNEITEGFEFASRELNIQSENDLPGRVRSTGSIQWISNIADETNLQRRRCALEAELKSGVAFPVVVDGAIAMVIELYTSETKLPSVDVFDLLAAIGRQIGQFVLSRRAQEINEQLVKIVESSTDAIYGMNLDLTITSWNEGAEKLYGYTAKEALGKNVLMIVPPDKVEELSESVERAKDGSRLEGRDSIRNGADGPIDVSLSLAPICKNGEIVGISEIDRDIRERKSAEKRVSEFYSIVSHELRTPLTSIRGALGLIEAGIVNQSSQKCMDLIKIGRESSDRLIRLINDILDLKKIEAGMFELQLEPIAADRLLEEAVNSMKGMAVERGVKLSLDKGPDHVTVHADKDRCTQVLANLISNALKFSQNGSEVVVNGIVDAEQIRFNISDNGPGIAESELQKLFQKFQQLDSSDNRKCEGTGLGLAISKALVEQHGGHIGVRSEVGKGSTFWFELPLKSNAESKIAINS
ncbi:MAG: PAS domain S-box protein [Leptolyngbya sp.]|nr:PAS domain S-box protein [Candidatus Melainabacteria bacterium]